MEIRLNSKMHTLPYPISVAELLEQQKVSSKGTAVAINGKIVRRTDWNARILTEGDDIIIIAAAYGG